MPESTNAPGSTEEQEAQEVKETFDINTALNNREFVDFLGRYEDAEEVEGLGETEIKARYEAFQDRNTGEKLLTELYNEDIKENLDVDLSPEAKTALRDFLYEEARDNPEALKERVGELKRYKELKGTVQELDLEIESLGGRENKEAALFKLEEKEKELTARTPSKWYYTSAPGELMRKAAKFLSHPTSLGFYAGTAAFFASPVFGAAFLGFGGAKVFSKLAERGAFGQQTKEEMTTRKRLGSMPKEERVKFFEGIDEKVKKIAKVREVLKADTLETQKEGLRELKEKLFGGFEGTKRVYQVALAQSLEKISALAQEGVKKQDVSSLETAQKKLEKYAGAREKIVAQQGEEFEAEELSDEAAENIRADLNQRIETVTSAVMNKGIAELKLGSRAFTDLEKILKPYTEKARIGSKEGTEIRGFISDTISETIGKFIEEIKKLDAKISEEKAKIKELKAKERSPESPEKKIQTQKDIKKSEKQFEEVFKKRQDLKAKIILSKGLIAKLSR